MLFAVLPGTQLLLHSHRRQRENALNYAASRLLQLCGDQNQAPYLLEDKPLLPLHVEGSQHHSTCLPQHDLGRARYALEARAVRIFGRSVDGVLRLRGSQDRELLAADWPGEEQDSQHEAHRGEVQANCSRCRQEGVRIRVHEVHEESRFPAAEVLQD